jgi:hypothetical protein
VGGTAPRFIPLNLGGISPAEVVHVGTEADEVAGHDRLCRNDGREVERHRATVTAARTALEVRSPGIVVGGNSPHRSRSTDAVTAEGTPS